MTFRPRRATTRPVRVLLDDPALVVADKPAGLLTIGTAQERRRTLYRYLFERERRRVRRGRVFIVHRLDRDASGLVVLAKTEAIQGALQAQFRAHTARRTYRAVVAGRYPRDDDVLRCSLAENAAFHVYVTTGSQGRPAVTHLKVLQRGAGVSLLELVLETGRKHQIRVQLAAAGYPILGDRRYGPDVAGPLGRLALHATALAFEHPTRDEPVRLHSPCPPSFARALRGSAR